MKEDNSKLLHLMWGHQPSEPLGKPQGGTTQRPGCPAAGPGIQLCSPQQAGNSAFCLAESIPFRVPPDCAGSPHFIPVAPGPHLVTPYKTWAEQFFKPEWT